MKAGLALVFGRRQRQLAQELAARRALQGAGALRSADPLEREYAVMLQGLEALREEESPIRREARAAWREAGRGKPMRIGSLSALALAACACLAWFLGVPLYRAHVPQFEAAYAPPASGAAGLALPDGSMLEMNVDARASVRYYADRREVTLHEGEAFFSVARDPARRFEVVAGSTRVRATGTQFNVRLRGPQLEVAVREGSVAVDGPGGSPVIALAAGQRLRHAERLPDAVRDDIPPEMIGAWKQGFLAVYRMPLADLPDELARYHLPRIEVDPGVAGLQISGAFRLRDFDALIESIAGIHPVQVDRIAGGVRLAPAAAMEMPLQPPGPIDREPRIRPAR